MYHCAMLVSHWLSFICSLVILLLITNYTDWHTSLLFVFWPTCFYHHQFLSKDPDLACIGKSWQACQHRLAVRVMWGTKQHEENRKQLMPLTPKNCWYTGEEDFGIGNELHMCCHETLGGWVDTDTHMDTKHPLVFLYRHKRLTRLRRVWQCTSTSNFSTSQCSDIWRRQGDKELAPISWLPSVNTGKTWPILCP